MSLNSHLNLKSIRFEGQLLPNWAQLLDVVARLSPVSEETRQWFSRFTKCSGGDDARTIISQCEGLRASIQKNRESILTELQRRGEDNQPSQILGAWVYALDTMILEAHGKTTCSWIVEDGAENEADGSEGGDVTLRRL